MMKLVLAVFLQILFGIQDEGIFQVRQIQDLQYGIWGDLLCFLLPKKYFLSGMYGLIRSVIIVFLRNLNFDMVYI